MVPQYHNSSIPIQGLTGSGKNGADGPTATPLARVPEKSELEPARLPCLEATTVLATQLRRLHAQNLLINHLVKTPPVQVNLDILLVLMIDLRKHKFHFNWLLWQRLHLCQRISDCQLLSFGQRDRAGHLRTRSQLCRKLLSLGSLALSLGRLYRRLWDAFRAGNQPDWSTKRSVTINTSFKCIQLVLVPMQCLAA